MSSRCAENKFVLFLSFDLALAYIRRLLVLLLTLDRDSPS